MLGSLRHVTSYYDLANCRWMQIPHHSSIYKIMQPMVGSNRNLHTSVRQGMRTNHTLPPCPLLKKPVRWFTIYRQRPKAHLWLTVGDVKKELTMLLCHGEIRAHH